MGVRITETLNQLKQNNSKGLITFLMANDPTPADFRKILHALPDAGVDIIEIGMPFSDPVADGVSIQAAGKRAIANNTSIQNIFATVASFRKNNISTPVILMGYVNPILRLGYEAFFQQCASTGVDGVIIVDLPPEEEAGARILAKKEQIEIIRLITPKTDAKRFQNITRDCGGFLYFVSVSGITGTKKVDVASIADNIAMVRKYSDLPLAIGFGIKDKHSAKEVAKVADAIVIGSTLIDFCQKKYRQGKSGLELSQLVSAKITEFKKVLD